MGFILFEFLGWNLIVIFTLSGNSNWLGKKSPFGLGCSKFRLRVNQLFKAPSDKIKKKKTSLGFINIVKKMCEIKWQTLDEIF